MHHSTTVAKVFASHGFTVVPVDVSDVPLEYETMVSFYDEDDNMVAAVLVTDTVTNSDDATMARLEDATEEAGDQLALQVEDLSGAEIEVMQ